MVNPATSTANNAILKFVSTPNYIYFLCVLQPLLSRSIWPNKLAINNYRFFCLLLTQYDFQVYGFNFQKLQINTSSLRVLPATIKTYKNFKTQLSFISQLAYKYNKRWPRLTKKFKKKYKLPRTQNTRHVDLMHYVWKLAKAQKTNRLNYFSYWLATNETSHKTAAQKACRIYKERGAYWPTPHKSNTEWFRHCLRVRAAYNKTRAGGVLHGNLKYEAVHDTTSSQKPFFSLYNFFSKPSKLKLEAIKATLSTTPANYASVVHKRYTRRKVQYLQRPIINTLWKAQAHWQSVYSRKRRWTTRKFFHIFNRWFKQANKAHAYRNFGVPVWWILLRLGLFFSPLDYIHACNASLVMHNNTHPTGLSTLFRKGDIITFSPNFSTFPGWTNSVKTHRFRMSKKNAYIFFKNKTLWWKSKKKKYSVDALTNFWLLRSVPSWMEFDPGAAAIAAIKEPIGNWAILQTPERHNLEKLNTYKLNV